MSQAGKFWKEVDKRSKAKNESPVQVGQITGIKPLVILFNGLELSYANGDTIFVNHLMLDDLVSFTTAQPITCSDGTITENHTSIINEEIEAWLMSVHQRYILNVGDYVAVQKLGNNTYIVLDKLQKVGNEQ